MKPPELVALSPGPRSPGVPLPRFKDTRERFFAICQLSPCLVMPPPKGPKGARIISGFVDPRNRVPTPSALIKEDDVRLQIEFPTEKPSTFPQRSSHMIAFTLVRALGSLQWSAAGLKQKAPKTQLTAPLGLLRSSFFGFFLASDSWELPRSGTVHGSAP